MMKIAILSALAAGSCFGQLHSVEIRVSGLDCASCAGSVEPRLKRVRGVESATFHAERATASIKMAAANRVTLTTIRDALKGLGYTPGDAAIVVTGTVAEGRLSLPHQPGAFTLENHDKATGTVHVEGTVPAGTDTLRAGKVQELPTARN